MRTGVIAMAMLPPWVAYLSALVGWPNVDWIDPETLRLGMNVEYVSGLVFPIVCVLALDTRPPRAVRLALCLAFATAVSAFIQHGLGWEAVTLFWMGGVVTYAGWLFAMPSRSRVGALMARMLLTLSSLIPILFVVIIVGGITGADLLLLLGFVYFFTLQVLEASGAFAAFERRLSGAA